MLRNAAAFAWRHAAHALASWSVIFTMHRVGARDPLRLAPNENMKVSPVFLRRFIDAARSSGWTFVSLDQLYGSLSSGARQQRQIALTFDDGYRDNLDQAYPLLKAMKVPFCVYVTTDLVDGSLQPWWLALEDLLIAAKELPDPWGGRIDCQTEGEKISAFMRLRSSFMAHDHREREEIFDWLAQRLGKIGSPEASNRAMLSWDEVRQLAADPSVTIGAHCLTHPVLSALSRDESAREIKESKGRLEDELGLAVNHFAYPFGGEEDAGEREFELACSVGFKTAVTTRYGVIQKPPTNFHALPRIMLAETTDLSVISGGLARGSLRRLMRGIA